MEVQRSGDTLLLRDFVSVKMQTIMGPMWRLIQPLLTTITFTGIFGNIARLPTDVLPQFLFRFLITFGGLLLMYATPVIYPASSIPVRFQFLIKLNLMTPIIETFRYAFLGTCAIIPIVLLYSLVLMLLIVAVGSITFNRVEAAFMGIV